MDAIEHILHCSDGLLELTEQTFKIVVAFRMIAVAWADSAAIAVTMKNAG
jgi:hypothetical protein